MSAQVFLITGAASGIGRHLSGAIMRRGHRLLATDIDEEGLRAARAGWPGSDDHVRLQRLDIRDPAAWAAATARCVAELGGLDVLLNVAGYLHPGYAVDQPATEVDRHFDINAKGVVHGTTAAAAVMRQRGGGHIINFGSLAGVAPVPGNALYSASKFAVRGFSLATALELAPQIAVTLISPDAVATPMLERQVGYPEAALTFAGGRALTVEEIERAIFEDALPKRPMEIVLSGAPGRGMMARLAGLLPGPAAVFGPRLIALGRRRQEEVRRREPERRGAATPEDS